MNELAKGLLTMTIVVVVGYVVLGVFGLFSHAGTREPMSYSQEVPLFSKDGTVDIGTIDSPDKLPKLFFCLNQIKDKNDLLCLTANDKAKLIWLDIPIDVTPTAKEKSI